MKTSSATDLLPVIKAVVQAHLKRGVAPRS